MSVSLQTLLIDDGIGIGISMVGVALDILHTYVFDLISSTFSSFLRACVDF